MTIRELIAALEALPEPTKSAPALREDSELGVVLVRAISPAQYRLLSPSLPHFTISGIMIA